MHLQNTTIQHSAVPKTYDNPYDALPLVIGGLLLGSCCMSQAPWRPLLLFLAIVDLLLGSQRVAQEPWRPLFLLRACFWAPGA